MGAWSTEEDAALRKMWIEDGLTASQCAARFGRSRNAIIGRVHRLKLPKRKTGTAGLTWRTGKGGAKPSDRPIVIKALKPKTEKVVRQKKAKAAPKPAKETQIMADNPEFDLDLGALKADAWQPLESSLLLPLHALTERTCKWPLGTELPFTFCGCQPVAGSAYCATHRRRSIGLGTISEREAHRVKVKQLAAA